MLSWLGFGKKSKKPSTEENNDEVQSTTEHEHEQAITTDAVEPIDNKAIESTDGGVVEPVTAKETEQVPENTTEQVTEKPVAEAVEVSVTPAVVEPETEVTAVREAPTVNAEVIIDTKNIDEKITQEQSVDEAIKVIDTNLTNDVANDVLPEAKLLAEMEAAEQVDTTAEPEPEPEPEPKTEQPVEVKETKLGFFARLKQGLSKTRQNLGDGLVDLFRGKQINDDLFEELETHLLLADVGVETTMKIIDSLTQSASRKQLKDASALYDLLKIELKKVIKEVSQPLVIPQSDGPFVILMVGVNGVGKTTTIGKLAKQFQADGKSVMLAAGDTFRAAAVEQLQVWGERNDIPVIAQHTGADSASVIFDAINAAKARKVDVIIADTAGRLQNKAHLMEELKKVVRVMKKLDVNAPHEVMLTLDAGTGQNALSQTKLFNEAVGLTGLTITKLDGTAKGGVIFAVADKYSIPIRYLGVGEGIDDLRPFNGDDFIDALFSKS
ncbi:signal recognition particle-docking protein FtsY [Colwellia ponticola]|uniref:Signal recognition particle receptor FtsY n=1 Tax=Colwellia ponticola TaxID=2304625 RepID=A0A8H2PN09_9GAMM|nr:signal recognition particle-docking protein FtsY [Colwellia ponticola]